MLFKFMRFAKTIGLLCLLVGAICLAQEPFHSSLAWRQQQWRSGAEPWPQEDKLVAYFDTLDATNVIEDGGVVVVWTNKANLADSAISTNGPIYDGNAGPNGHPSIVFKANWFWFFNTTNALFERPPFTEAVMFSWHSNRCTVFSGDQSGGGEGRGLIRNEFAYTPYGLAFLPVTGSRNTTPDIRSGVLPTTNQHYIAVAVVGGYSGTESNYSYFYTNGVFVECYTNSFLIAPKIVTPFGIGRGAASYTQYHSGTISRVMLWRTALTSNECYLVYARILREFQ